MTIPKKPTRQRTSSPKKPPEATKPVAQPVAKAAVKAGGRPERKGPSEEAIAETILRLVAARDHDGDPGQGDVVSHGRRRGLFRAGMA